MPVTVVGWIMIEDSGLFLGNIGLIMKLRRMTIGKNFILNNIRTFTHQCTHQIPEDTKYDKQQKSTKHIEG